MTLQVAVLGIDGSGKTTLAGSLPLALAAEMGIRAGAAANDYWVVDAEEDLLAPNFHPKGLPLIARTSLLFKRMAKRSVDRRTLYPVFKLAQLMCQDAAVHRLARRYRTEAFISDGNLLLCAAGRRDNYRCPASDGASQQEPCSRQDHEAMFAYLLDGVPMPDESLRRLPRLTAARRLQKFARRLGREGIRLPDVVLFLDISPETGLERIASRGARLDRHENLADLNQARANYLKTLAAFAAYRGTDCVHLIDADGMTPGQVLQRAVAIVRSRIQTAQVRQRRAEAPLGTTATGAALARKLLNPRYLVLYLLRRWFQNAWREPFFIASASGRELLREGYSAGVMRVIYEQDQSRHGLLERTFLEYPLHRAVYDRLQILCGSIERELDERLRSGREVRILTAPSGFAFDILRPLDAIAARSPELLEQASVVAADLDPHGTLANELEERARRLGLRLRFIRGDLTGSVLRREIAAHGPFDLALFVGLSSWLPKPAMVAHLRWLGHQLREGGVLVTDCFTPAAYSIGGNYVGYKASYYTPEQYRALLDFCGFDGLGGSHQSGRDDLNHVLVVRGRPAARLDIRRDSACRHSQVVPQVLTSAALTPRPVLPAASRNPQDGAVKQAAVRQ